MSWINCVSLYEHTTRCISFEMCFFLQLDKAKTRMYMTLDVSSEFLVWSYGVSGKYIQHRICPKDMLYSVKKHIDIGHGSTTYVAAGIHMAKYCKIL